MAKKFVVTERNRQVINNFLEYRKSLKKSQETIDSDNYCISKLADFLGKNDFADTTEKDLQDFFQNVNTISTYNLLGIKFCVFYRWLFKLKRKQIPEIMEWWECRSKNAQVKEKDPDSIKNQFITPEEYKTILDNCWDKYGMWEAMYETYYLSGGRLNEVRNMNIKDVKMNNGNVSIILRKSKTIPREVPLAEYPDRLIRWLQNHPYKDNPEAPLWISIGARNKGNRVTEDGVYCYFYRIRNNTNIKDTLSIHSFRKTRATIMFNKRSEDGGLVYSDTHIAKFFGWKLHTVYSRREEYDLTTEEDLKYQVINSVLL